MIIGVPKEIKNNENRISMIPFGVEELTKAGHQVLVENNGGLGSGFTNEQYIAAGATIIDTAAEIFAKADMIVKVKEPQPVELEMIREGQIVFTYFHFAADRQLTLDFLKTKAIAIAYETVETDDRDLPLLVPMSEVAGRMAVQEGAKCLEANAGGRGVLMSGVPGVEPATVVVLGGGIVGANATKLAAGLGAKVYILDISPNRLKYLSDVMPPNVITLYSNSHNIKELLPQTDLLIGAVLLVGAKAPKLVTRDMLSLMRPRSVIVDVAVDQGGCVETCRPTTHEDPTFVEEGILHYCVANMPGAVPFTSTTALTNVTFPYVMQLANKGYRRALLDDPALLKGLNAINGKVTHWGVSEAFDLELIEPESIL